jgi:hypothetical protein
VNFVYILRASQAETIGFQNALNNTSNKHMLEVARSREILLGRDAVKYEKYISIGAGSKSSVKRNVDIEQMCFIDVLYFVQ